jgi:CubicO group peptidase (beta-lactamase class C family)
MQAARERSDFTAVGALLDGLVASGALPGANVLVHSEGKEAYYHEAGARDVEAALPIRRDTLFRIFSMTKPVTAAAVMTLVDAGELRLDDPVVNYIPEFADLQVFDGLKDGEIRSQPARQMTIAHLLTHTAGFTYWFQPSFSYWLEANTPLAGLYDTALGAGRFERWRFDPTLGGLDGLAKSLARVPLLNHPGERWHYSMALEVAGIVIERVSSRSLDVFFKTKLFEPLDMRDTNFSVSRDKRERLASLYGIAPEGGLERLENAKESPLLGPVIGFSGGGGLISTVDDYARFAEMLAQGGQLDGHRVLSKAAVDLMMTNRLQPPQLTELPELAIFGLGGAGDGLGFGLGGAVVTEPVKIGTPAFQGEYSWGGAASTTFWVDPHNKLSVVLMTQLLPPSSEMLRDKLHTAVYAAFGR